MIRGTFANIRLGNTLVPGIEGGFYSIAGLEAGGDALPSTVTVRVDDDGQRREFEASVRIDTLAEAAYYRHGGVLKYVLRQLLGDAGIKAVTTR